MITLIRSLVAKSLPKSQMTLALVMIQIKDTFSIPLTVAFISYLFLAFALHHFEPIVKSSNGIINNLYQEPFVTLVLTGAVSRLFCYPIVTVFYFYVIKNLIQTAIFFAFCFILYAIDRILYNGLYLKRRYTF